MNSEVSLTPADTPNVEPVSATPHRSTRHVRVWVGRAIAIVAVLCMVISGYHFGWDPNVGFQVPYEGLKWLVFGLVALCLSIFLIQSPIKVFELDKQAAPVRTRINVGVTGLGILQLLALAEINGKLIFHGLLVSEHIQFLLFVGGLVALTVGLGGFHGISLAGLRNRRGVILCLAGLMLIAFGLRYWHLASAFHVSVDEVNFGESVLWLQEYPSTPLMLPGNYISAFTRISPYLQRWTVGIFGPDLDGLRFPSVIFGVLSIPALYLLGEALFDSNLGLLAAALLVVFPPHIHFSRIGLNNIFDPVFGTLAFAFLVRGFRRNSHPDYILAGVCLGLCSYFYEGGRLLFPVVFIAWLGIAVVVYRPLSHWRGWAIMLFATAIVMMPYLYTLYGNHFPFSPRANLEGGSFTDFIYNVKSTSLLDAIVKQYHDNLQYSMLHLVYLPDDSVYYGGQTGLLLQFVSPFFLLGLGFALWRWRAVGLFILSWIGIGIVAVSFVGRDNTERFVVFFPILILIVAIGLRYSVELIGGMSPKPVLNLVIIAIAVVGGALEVQYYFGPHLTYYNVQVRNGIHDFYNVFYEAMKYPNAKLYFLAPDGVVGETLIEMLELSNNHLEFDVWWDKSKVTRQALLSLPQDKTLLFAVMPTDMDTIALLRETYNPKGPFWSSLDSVPREVQFALFSYQPKALLRF